MPRNPSWSCPLLLPRKSPSIGSEFLKVSPSVALIQLSQFVYNDDMVSVHHSGLQPLHTVTVQGGTSGLSHTQGAFVLGRGYLYAGLEFGAECYCGHKILAVNVSDTECDMECKGEKSSFCGGANRLSIYRLELAQESTRRCECGFRF